MRTDGMAPPHRLLAGLTHNLFVIKFGWRGWGPAARLRWLRKLRATCALTIDLIDYQLGVDHPPQASGGEQA